MTPAGLEGAGGRAPSYDECPDCGETFPDVRTLRTHRADTHGTVIRDGASLTDQERVDIQSEDSFPASDAPSSSPVQGVGSPRRAAED